MGVSLIPKPFLLPVFDRLQYTKTEGEGLGEKDASCQVDVKVAVRGAVPDKNLEVLLVISYPRT